MIDSRHPRQAAVMTYHRVTDTPPAEIYDVTWEAFLRQLSILQDRLGAIANGNILLESGLTVRLTFDDGTADHRRVAKELDAFGVPGTFFVIVDRLGQADYLTRDDIRALAAAGHTIGSHTISHRPTTSLSASELRQELVTSKRSLEDISGQEVAWLAFPGGFYSPSVRRQNVWDV